MDIDKSARQLATSLKTLVELMQVMARACGHSHLNQFSPEDISTFDWQLAWLSGIPFSGFQADRD